MIDYRALYPQLVDTPLQAIGTALPALIEQRFSPQHHGVFEKWQTALKALPAIKADSVALNADAISAASNADNNTRQQIEAGLKQLHPWRKGPFNMHGVHIDTEWRSDWKWDRLKDHIAPLTGRTVLDIGCGSGYHCWRMAGAGARLVIGIEPMLLYVMQYFAIRHFVGENNTYVLPMGIEDLPPRLQAFDTVFSMGVLYHRRSPLDHLIELRDALRPGGELVLETIVTDGDAGYSLMPQGRYAKMRNVWFLPSVATLEQWLKRCGFKNIRTVDVNRTSRREQRSTEWMTFDSLESFLSPDDPTLTIEGHPAPTRAITIAERA